MLMQPACETYVGRVARELGEVADALLLVEFGKRLRPLDRVTRPLHLLRGAVENAWVCLNGLHPLEIFHAADDGCVLPDLSARHVILARKDDIAFIIDIRAHQGSRIRFAVVKTADDIPAAVRAPRRILDDDLVPMRDQDVGKDKFTATRLVHNLLLPIPCSLRWVS